MIETFANIDKELRKELGQESLLEIAQRNGADKCKEHSYLQVYEKLLSPLRDQEITLLEIGVLNGGSLLTWLDWMPKAQVIGIDVVLPDIKHERLTMHVCHQTDGERLVEPWKGIFPIDQPPSLDVIIDDGSHHIEHQLVTLHYLWHALKPGGLYFVEDVQDADFLPFFNVFPGFRVWDFTVTDANARYDDRMVLLVKPEN